MAETTERAMTFSPRERSVWDATFAAAFASEFMAEWSRRGRFDAAAQSMTAETAGTIADLAILRLREWRRDNDRRLGTSSYIARHYAIEDEGT